MVLERFRRAACTLAANVDADLQAMRQGRAKYLGEPPALASPLAIEFVTKIGFQMMVAIRAMQFLKDARVPLGPQVASRMIRYVYGAEIHWDAHIGPGTNIVHGNGLVIGSSVVVGEGCILLHNVTLGAAYDPASGKSVGPVLGAGVHVGPGATIIGPVRVGAGAKIMAGAVVDRSVPEGALVSPPPSVITTRQRRSGGDA